MQLPKSQTSRHWDDWPKWKHALAWALQATACLLFLAAGLAKLVGVQEAVAMFADIGAGQWLRYLTGILEVIGAGLILFPTTASLGSVLLGLIMIGAVFTHVLVLGTSPIIPLACLVLVVLIGRLRRPPLDQGAERSGLWTTGEQGG